LASGRPLDGAVSDGASTSITQHARVALALLESALDFGGRLEVTLVKSRAVECDEIITILV
jgi:hypothetical protein